VVFAIRKAPLQADSEIIRDLEGEVAHYIRNSVVAEACLTPPSEDEEESPPEGARWFSATIDTGFSGDLMISGKQLALLAGQSIDLFSICGTTNLFMASGKPDRGVARRNGVLWLRSTTANASYLRIELGQGLIYYATDGPPSPLIGAGVLAAAKLHLIVDYDEKSYSMLQFCRFGAFLLKKGVVSVQQLHNALDYQLNNSTANGFTPNGEHIPPPPLVGRLLRTRCHPTDAGDLIGKAAVTSGILSESDLARMLDGGDHSHDLKLGQVLVKQQILDPKALEQLLYEFHRSFSHGGSSIL
jgi:hypothetical protein